MPPLCLPAAWYSPLPQLSGPNTHCRPPTEHCHPLWSARSFDWLTECFKSTTWDIKHKHPFPFIMCPLSLRAMDAEVQSKQGYHSFCSGQRDWLSYAVSLGNYLGLMGCCMSSDRKMSDILKLTAKSGIF